MTPYRVLTTVALVAAALLLVLGLNTVHSTRPANCGQGPILALIPCPNDTILHQGLIGVTLQAGYDAVLRVDGSEIPPDELRTAGSNQLYYQPGPDTITGALAPGRHTITVLYWPGTSDRSHALSYTWPFIAQ